MVTVRMVCEIELVRFTRVSIPPPECFWEAEPVLRDLFSPVPELHPLLEVGSGSEHPFEPCRLLTQPLITVFLQHIREDTGISHGPVRECPRPFGQPPTRGQLIFGVL